MAPKLILVALLCIIEYLLDRVVEFLSAGSGDEADDGRDREKLFVDLVMAHPRLIQAKDDLLLLAQAARPYPLYIQSSPLREFIIIFSPYYDCCILSYAVAEIYYRAKGDLRGVMRCYLQHPHYKVKSK